MFRDLASARPSSAALADQKSRMGQGADINTALQANPPVGAMVDWGGQSDPPGGVWLICDGRLLGRAAYPDLFAVYGTTYNIGGEDPTMFRIPDRRGRVPVGAGTGTGLTNRALGSTLGEENHILVVSEMPSHAHSGNTSFDSHQHVYDDVGIGSTYGLPTTTGAINAVIGLSHTNTNTSPTGHQHTVSSSGSDGSHNNMQPSLAVNVIVRALA